LVGRLDRGPFSREAVQSEASDDHFMRRPSAVCTIGLNHILVTTFKRHPPRLGHLVAGTPTVTYKKGQWHDERMRRFRLLEQNAMTAPRQRGLQWLDRVRYAVAERDGRISIIAEAEG